MGEDKISRVPFHSFTSSDMVSMTTNIRGIFLHIDQSLESIRSTDKSNGFEISIRIAKISAS